MIETLQKRSSNIASATYDSDTQELVVAFHSGATWKYRSVPQSVWMGMQNSQSIGEYFARQVRGRYSDERVD